MELAVLLLGAGTLWATPSSAFSVPVPSPKGDFSDFHEYTKSHVGRWRGLWRTYDSEGAEQGDPDRMDTTLDLSPDGKTLTHVNTLFVGSVDSECTTCHDSVETRDIPVGTYTKDTFRQRAASGCYLSGPGITRRGNMKTEVGLTVDHDRRVRVIVSHRPVFNGVEPPSQLSLERVVVVSEIRAREQSPPAIDPSWSFDRPSWLGLWRGDAKILGNEADGSLAWKEEAVPPSHLRKCRCSGADGDNSDSHSSFEFDGGVRVEVSKLVDAGMPTEMLVRLAVGRKSKAAAPNCVVQTKVQFEALSRVMDTAQNTVRISPPALLRFTVETLTPVASAGLG